MDEPILPITRRRRAPILPFRFSIMNALADEDAIVDRPDLTTTSEARALWLDPRWALPGDPVCVSEAKIERMIAEGADPASIDYVVSTVFVVIGQSGRVVWLCEAIENPDAYDLYELVGDALPVPFEDFVAGMERTRPEWVLSSGKKTE